MSTLQPDTLIKNPQGCHVVSSVEVPADARKVWAVVGNFAGFDQFIPALSHIEMTGEGVSSLVEPWGPRRSRATWTVIAEPAQGGAEALPGFTDFVQGFADDSMNNVLKLFA